jgi:hypothetical protein
MDCIGHDGKAVCPQPAYDLKYREDKVQKEG